jgi:hypothetical protein
MENVQDFDPYQHWLGIPRAEQPPNHYRLLDIRLFEADAAAIERAAQQRTMLLRSIDLETHADVAQRLLKDVAAAGACLLTPEKKQRYDLALRARVAPTQASAGTRPTGGVANRQSPAGATKSAIPPAMASSGFSPAVADLLSELPKPKLEPTPPGKWEQWQRRLTHLAFVLIGIVVAAILLTLIVWIVEQIAPEDLSWWKSDT